MHREVKSLLLITLLVPYLVCPDWQASGNMTGYIETIRGFFDDAIMDDLGVDVFAPNITARCNAEWDEFWDVVVFWMSAPGTDICMNSYAHKGHWYWHSNYYGPQNLSFAVWKDVYCDFNTLNQGNPTLVSSNTMITDATEEITADPNLGNDIWQWGHRTLLNHGTRLPFSHFLLSGVFLNGFFEKVSVSTCRSSAVSSQTPKVFKQTLGGHQLSEYFLISHATF